MNNLLVWLVIILSVSLVVMIILYLDERQRVIRVKEAMDSYKTRYNELLCGPTKLIKPGAQFPPEIETLPWQMRNEALYDQYKTLEATVHDQLDAWQRDWKLVLAYLGLEFVNIPPTPARRMVHNVNPPEAGED